MYFVRGRSGCFVCVVIRKSVILVVSIVEVKMVRGGLVVVL